MNRVVRINGCYRFRARVPKDISQFFKVNEIRKSLHTKSFKHAKILATVYNYRLEELFLRMRCGMLDDKQIEALVQQFFEKTLAELEHERIEGAGTPTLDELEDPENEQIDDYGMLYNGCNEAIDQGMKAYLTKDYSYIAPFTDELLEDNQIETEKDSHQYKVLCNEMLKAWVKVHEIEKDKLMGRDNSIDILTSSSSASASASLTSSSAASTAMKTRGAPDGRSKGIPLSKAIKMFIDEKILKKEFNQKTVIDSLSIFGVLLDVLGDVDVNTIDKQTAMKFADAVSRLPKNRNKRKEYRNRPIAEVLKIAEKKNETSLLSDSSKAKYVERASMLFNWCVDADFVEKNYFKKLSVKYDEEEGQRRPFSPEELLRLKNSPIFKSKRIPVEKAHQFFIPLIALFTGMRMNEICQLYTEDIQEIQGVWCIDVNKNTPDKRLKTKSSRRTIPIHPVLIRAGLIKFKRLMEKQHHNRNSAPNLQRRMWLGLRFTKGTYKEQFSKWFNRYCDDHITDDRRIVFHSFRNTFVDNLKQQGEQEALVAGIVGHENPNITFKTYGQGYNPEPLLRVVMKLQYAKVFDDVRFSF